MPGEPVAGLRSVQRLAGSASVQACCHPVSFHGGQGWAACQNPRPHPRMHADHGGLLAGRHAAGRLCHAQLHCAGLVPAAGAHAASLWLAASYSCVWGPIGRCLGRRACCRRICGRTVLLCVREEPMLAGLLAASVAMLRCACQSVSRVYATPRHVCEGCGIFSMKH